MTIFISFSKFYFAEIRKNSVKITEKDNPREIPFSQALQGLQLHDTNQKFILPVLPCKANPESASLNFFLKSEEISQSNRIRYLNIC